MNISQRSWETASRWRMLHSTELSGENQMWTFWENEVTKFEKKKKDILKKGWDTGYNVKNTKSILLSDP